MSLRSFYIIFGLMMCLQQFSVNGSPQLHLRKLYGYGGELRTKKDNIAAIPQVDEDVLELEHLKQKPFIDNTDGNSGETDSDTSSDDNLSNTGTAIDSSTFEESVNSDEPLPTLEKQLELEAAKMNPNINKNDDDTTNSDGINIPGQPEREEEVIIQHKPPHLPSFAKQQTVPSLKKPIELETNAQEINNNEQFNQEIHEANEKSPSPAKSFYGAARLAFGQNPEIVPTQSTTSSTTHTATIVASTTTDESDDSIIPENIINSPSSSSSSDILGSIVDASGVSIATATSKNIPHPLNDDNNNNNKDDVIDDSIVTELEATKGNVERRSIERTLPKSAETLLKRAESSFDMAQYVFWTGDEAGVARAVEEYIEQGLMSRENALRFLREIRMGVDYLQQSYDHRIFAEQKENDFKKNDNSEHPKSVHHQSKRVTTDNNFMDLQEKHLPKLQQQQQQHHHQHVTPSQHQSTSSQTLENQKVNQQMKSNIQKTLDEIPTLLRLREVSNEQRKVNINNDEDDMAGRARLADFIYTEYTLEEIIYQLAKVMFSKSLTHDSAQSQKALQRLTSFLETEGELGRISSSLQKKVLDVLLAALSDTLGNHPELLAAARANLGKTFHQIQDNSFESIMKH